ncbi:M48 family metallopeptidase [Dasania sp. GY-MA-18]|uniref:SprT family zinc-dependent metalloprotease n=1 Tax=Dasania phycosphaerae TaxID=2950436 RepID=A0A9J6RMQ0_9GAMM|nr:MULTISPECIES: SprT family zinc-dependent metalloprotease [Dasania]MCR8923202.1 M48 family metallopeptidase [Dasania sp. GY-MA-18]MCZ0865634.1 SprT family zinc-dependent metalloprotease [Dasania phycosphaerae]MCZ0869359.1 SprT family zinc-dependent metalloprotease [Dasania phycosphaerae]
MVAAREPSQKVHTYKDIEFTLKKSERKTTSIYIERDGSVSVLAPKPFDMERVQATLEKKRSWIYRNLAEWEDLNRTRVHREYVNGESFLYLGRRYQLELVKTQGVPLALKQGKFCLVKDLVPKAERYFQEFYKNKLKPRLDERIDQYAPRLGVSPRRVKVMELKNRWGSCSATGMINVHWKCAMLPLSVLDYIVVHELSHIENPNHTPAFWRAVEKALPNYEEQKKWLKFNGAGMSL